MRTRSWSWLSWNALRRSACVSSLCVAGMIITMSTVVSAWWFWLVMLYTYSAALNVVVARSGKAFAVVWRSTIWSSLTLPPLVWRMVTVLSALSTLPSVKVRVVTAALLYLSGPLVALTVPTSESFSSTWALNAAS